MDTYKNREEQLYLAAYGLWLACAVLEITLWGKYPYADDIADYGQKLAYVLLLFQFISRKQYSPRDIAALYLMLFGCALAANSVYNKQLIPVVLFIGCSRDIDYTKILKCTLAVQGILFILTAGASMLGVIEDVIWYEGSRVRHSLGYSYCGYPAHLIFFLTLVVLYLRKKARVLDAVCLLALNYVIYMATDSRTDFYLAVLGILGFFLWTGSFRAKWFETLRCLTVEYGFAAAAVFSIAMHIFYDADTAWMQRLNQVLNGRLQLGYDAIQEYGFSIFGRPIRWFGQGSLLSDPTRIYNYVDSSFLKETLSYGILFLILLAAGYYLLGKRISRTRDHALGWVILMSLLYSITNAHLCVLTFNVFILALGRLFAGPGVAYSESHTVCMASASEKWFHGFRPHTGAWLAVLAACRPEKTDEKKRRILRTGVFLAVLCYTSILQYLGIKHIVKHASVHMCVICGLLLLLAVLCTEKSAGNYRIKGVLSHIVFCFLLTACISDFFVDKRFSGSSFGLLIFGGIFCCSWSRMQNPEYLLEECRQACKIWFIGMLVLCAVFFPVLPGVPYCGMFYSAKIFGACMLIAMGVFLSDFSSGKNPVRNGLGVISSLYLVWLSREMLLVFIAAAVLLFCMAFRIFLCFRDGAFRSPGEKIKMIPVLVLGIAGIILLQYVLSDSAVSDTIQTRLWLAEEYLMQMNLLGHRHLAEIAGKARWAQNGFVMVAFRYGIIAGVLYIAAAFLYLWKAIRAALTRRDFFPFALAFICIAVSMAEPVEMPFGQIVWLLFYFGAAWALVAERGENG